MATLAQKYGLSDVGLAKICRKLDVPVPWRGYWRKKDVGQKVKRPALPKLPPSATPATREVTRRRTASGSAVAEPSGPVAEQQRYEALEENRIVVPELLTDPHPLVAKCVNALRHAKRNPSGYLQPKTRPCLAVFVTLDSADRAMCIYDALLEGLDARGYPATIIRPEDPYGGRRVTLLARLGQARLRVQVDVGIGEAVTPAPVWLDYPSLLDLARPRLRAYQPETAIAEKLHAMVVLGSKNRRMRDFLDVHALATHHSFAGHVLDDALRATFARRSTHFPADTPIALTPAFAALEGRRAQWSGFIRD